MSLYEAGDYFGGHSNTVEVCVDGVCHGVDTGFLSFNPQTSPLLASLLDELGVETTDSDSGCSFQLAADGRMLEWADGGLDQVFHQRANLLRPSFLRMLREIARFKRAASTLARHPLGIDPAASLGAYLDRHAYSAQFRQWYLLPVAAGLWSCPPQQMLELPLAGFVRYCHHHGLLRPCARPRWRTVRGGARQYVRKLLAALPDRRLLSPVLAVTRGASGVTLMTAQGLEHYDQVVLACHSDQSLAILADASAQESALLSGVRYQSSRTVLHTDTSLLPGDRRLWAARNYEGGPDGDACVHQLLNRLQPLPFAQPFIVSTNPLREPDPASVIRDHVYRRPLADMAAGAARLHLPELQGRNRAWFAGAWTGDGFHEDGLKSGLDTAAAIIAGTQAARAA